MPNTCSNANLNLSDMCLLFFVGRDNNDGLHLCLHQSDRFGFNLGLARLNDGCLRFALGQIVVRHFCLLVEVGRDRE